MNDLRWNKNFKGEVVVVQLGGPGNFTQKSYLIADINTSSFLGAALYPVSFQSDTIWVVDNDLDTQATHVDASQILWWKNERLNLLYGKT